MEASGSWFSLYVDKYIMSVCLHVCTCGSFVNVPFIWYSSFSHILINPFLNCNSQPILFSTSSSSSWSQPLLLIFCLISFVAHFLFFLLPFTSLFLPSPRLTLHSTPPFSSPLCSSLPPNFLPLHHLLSLTLLTLLPIITSVPSSPGPR